MSANTEPRLNASGSSTSVRHAALISGDTADPSEEGRMVIDHQGLVVERHADGAEGPKGRRPVPRPRWPGISATGRDIEIAKEHLRAQMLREGWGARPSEDFAGELERRLAEFLALPHPKLLGKYAELVQTSWCPDRAAIRDHIEVKAVRRLPELAQLEAALTDCSAGRPSKRRLPLAVFERLALGDCDPTIRSAVKDFCGSNRELDWAYWDTTQPGEIKPHLTDETCLRKTMKSMLERNDPELVWQLNASVLARIASRNKDFGRYLVVDATELEASLIQSGNLSEKHKQLLNRGTGADFGHHASRTSRPKSVRGWRLLILTDIITGLAISAILIPANASEFCHLPDLLDKAFRYCPWLRPEYLVGDSEFDRSTRLAFDLQSRYGITPVFDLRENLGSSWKWDSTQGVPQCSRHGEMHYHQADDLVPDSVPVRYDPDFEQAKSLYAGRIRWICRGCQSEGQKVRATTYIRDNARIYTALPRQGENHRVALRRALELRRNCAESFNAQIKLRGLHMRGTKKARWVTKRRHMEWLAYLSVASVTFRREAHEAGLYRDAAEEACGLSLVKTSLEVPANAVAAKDSTA